MIVSVMKGTFIGGGWLLKSHSMMNGEENFSKSLIGMVMNWKNNQENNNFYYCI